MLAPWKKNYDEPRQHIKKQRHHFAGKGPYSQSCDFSSSYVWIWVSDRKEGLELKNWCFWIVVLEKTPESSLDSKIKPVNPKGNQSWIFIEKTDAWSWSSDTLATWCKEPTHWKRPRWWETWKAGEEYYNGGWDDWMASLPQWTWVWANSRRYEGQGILACCSSWSCQESGRT